MNFYSEMFKSLLLNSKNDFSNKDNFDHYRFGKIKETRITISNRIKSGLQKILNTKGYLIVQKESFELTKLGVLETYLGDLEFMFNALNDLESKKLLLQIVTYRLLGYKKVKLPLSNPSYWKGISEIKEMSDVNNCLSVKFLNWKLYLTDLSKIGLPIKLYFHPIGTYTDFVVKQYEYNIGGKVIKAEKDDYVIDAGGCWGDTALYFANEVGEKGKVFTYEFIPSNIDIFIKNISLNPNLANRINLIRNPVWDVSDKAMFYVDNGPGSLVFMNENMPYDGKADSLSIDDLVIKNNISRVDFIKMDIEGAEQFALRGAEGTIKRYKPKLAIAIYHSMNDFVNIPKYLINLNLGYKLYLAHCSIHEEETILFASI